MKMAQIIPIINNISYLPSPKSINLWWNYGSLLGICLGSQILTGVFLAMHYSNDVIIAFERVSHIMRDVNGGWMLRTLHANGARIFFISLYLHVGRGLYYGSYHLLHVWGVGVSVLFIRIATAFLGYVLPWGQMSFWGTTVITNLISAIPYVGNDIVVWLWGGFAVDNATLTRFFTFHFLFPFIIAALVIVHIFFLHSTGSNNPLGLFLQIQKISFHPLFTTKDLLGGVLIFFNLAIVCIYIPWKIGDPENFIPANPLVTPTHIQPEWYFLFAYAILRSIPNKLGGVIALVASVVILLIITIAPNTGQRSAGFVPIKKAMFWRICAVFFILTWIGARPVEAPYIIIGQISTCVYFFLFICFPFLKIFWFQLQ